MKIEKQSRVVIDVTVAEAQVLGYCLARVMESCDYMDVLPDNLYTKQVLKEVCDNLRPLI